MIFARSLNLIIVHLRLILKSRLHNLTWDATDRDIVTVSTFVTAPGVVLAECDTFFRSSTLNIVQPNRSITGTVAVTNNPSAVPVSINVKISRRINDNDIRSLQHQKRQPKTWTTERNRAMQKRWRCWSRPTEPHERLNTHRSSKIIMCSFTKVDFYQFYKAFLILVL